MPYLGNVPAENYAQVSYQDLTGGSGTSFTLDYPVGSAGEIEVFVNNVRQEPTVAYTVNGTALTMTGSVAATDDFYIVFQGKAEKSGTIPEKQTDGTYVFPDDVTVSGNITSTGIDDNATSTAMTLDSSGNLLVGTTNANPTSAGVNDPGVELSNTGGVRSTVASNPAATFNRKTDDGAIALFRKDGTTVGSIGVESGDLKIGHNTAALDFLSSESRIRPWNMSTNLPNDNAVDLGRSNTRFKDLYLSGGVYLGGTGSANYLDDYEEGTFTPSWTNTSSATYNAQIGKYTKVGNVVFYYVRLDSASLTFTGAPYIAGLPFTSNATTNLYSNAYTFPTTRFENLGNGGIVGQIAPNTTQVQLYYLTSSSGANYNVVDGTVINETSQVVINVSGHYYV